MKTIVLIAITALVVQALGYGDGIEYNQWEGKTQAFLDQFQEEADAEPDEQGYAMRDDTGTSDETGPPSDDYMREIMDQPVPADGQMAYDQVSDDELRKEILNQPVSVPSKVLPVFSSGAVYHGSYVAFQLLYNKRYYIRCSQNPCTKGVCPRLYMEGNDWNNCYGEVFRIYRFSGPGQVRAGEVIAINYPKESGKWFGCGGPFCGKSSCPGSPTYQYGMQSREKWFQCWGEVFKIYARGKSLGTPIYSHDDIMLFYLQEQKWIGISGPYPTKHACPGIVRPPPPFRYDMCWADNFELWER